MKQGILRAIMAMLVIALLSCNMVIPVHAVTGKEGIQAITHPSETISSETISTVPTNEVMNHENMVENALQSLIVNDSLSRIGWALAMFIIALALIGWAFGQITRGFAQFIIALTGVYTAVVQSLNPIINAADMALTKTIDYCYRFNTRVNAVIISRLSATTDNYLHLTLIAAATSIPSIIVLIMAACNLISGLINSDLSISTTIFLIIQGIVLAYLPIKVGMLAWTKYLNKKK